ncbi:MAG: HelD family protein [Mycobacteriales bacterium]
MRVETQALDPASVAVGEWAVTAQLGQWGMGRLRAERLASLADDPLVPPFFGRTDGAGGVLHIGRRHIRDPAAEPLVVDWRAPVSVGFYRATAAEPMGVRRRRRFGFHAGALSSFEDEDIAAGQGKGSVLLAAEIERPRVGPMRDIVATIAPDQDEMVREALGDDLCIQGAPGTGKTAVGLHRAAYLLYTYPEKLRRAGVLIVGPNRAFLGYVAAVLPALGEIDVCQVTVDELVERVPITAQDSPAAALVKADARMAGVLRRAVYCGITGPTGPLTITLGARRYRVPEPRLRRYLEELRRGEVRYSAARSRLPTRIAADLRRQREDDGGTLTEREATRLARSRDVRDAVDGLWPAVAPETVLHRLFCDPEFLARCARDDLTETEQHALVWTRPARTAKTARWSRADAVLLDEIADLLERTHQVGHVVIDEAQDLSPMQARAIGRRAETGSITVLGDLAQGTTPWAATAWTDVLVPLGKPAATITELSLAYRVPEEILKLANRLLPTIGPALAPARSVRRGEPDAVQIRTSDEPIAAILIATEELLRRDGSIGIIVPEPQTSAVSAALAAAGIEHLDLDANVEQTEPRVTVVPATVVNGLEFDHVVLLEPAQIAAGPRGLNRLYVALTRAVSQLIVVHAEPLPIALIAA